MAVHPLATEHRPARMERRRAPTARRRTAAEGRRARTGHRPTGAAGRRAVTVHRRAVTVHRPAPTARRRTAVEGRPATTAPLPSGAAVAVASVTGSPPAMAHPRAVAARYPRATVHPPGEAAAARPPPTVHPTEEAVDTRDHLPLTVHLAPVVAVSEGKGSFFLFPSLFVDSKRSTAHYAARFQLQKRSIFEDNTLYLFHCTLSYPFKKDECTMAIN